ncbi:MAG: TM0106 family RecB-like putative nuclease [Corynebacterium casei]|uniref:TM0106 family RecB-like putative nuclease n=1 Tax=Corynebacterium casei TaxID=160386 RepID=UPI002649C2E4|nr:TM0106 family RecB-like putative nuclease [Corynebacterium casei]MDN6465929.1 TM0106 family RecB-like putative nuclease [Corynebacterium casei]
MLIRVENQVRASDLVGCRYRLVQRHTHPEVPRTEAAQARADRYDAARSAVWENFPRKSDSRRIPFRRIDLGPIPAEDPWLRSLETLEALATGATHITGAVFANEKWLVGGDMVGREGASASNGSYTPVMVSTHRVARKHDKAKTLGVPTHRLGLSEPLELGYKPRHHVLDGYHLAMAARALDDLGLNSGRGVLIGQDRNLAFYTDTATYQPALDAALDAVELENLPTQPRRVKECASCRFWPLCKPELEAMDEISLFLPGDRARPYRERGIETVQGLIDASLGTPSQLAAAWRDGTVLLAHGDITVPRADVEIDVDMEAYMDQGAYLWGAWMDGTYYDFVTWEMLGSKAEARNFAEFWTWLMEQRDNAHAAGKTFAAYCYSAHGENHWMRMSAQRFHAHTPGVPSVEEVDAFINSGEWVDMFAHVKANFVGPFGLSLKTVAPQAGFHWEQGDFDGEESVNARRVAIGTDAAALTAREMLLTYNADDVQATLAVREWMSDNAPNTPRLSA